MIMPPIGINVLVINSLARDVPLWTISKGVMPFILSDLVRLTLLVAFPISPHSCRGGCRVGRGAGLHPAGTGMQRRAMAILGETAGRPSPATRCPTTACPSRLR